MRSVRDQGLDPTGRDRRRCCGAGGAARAIVLALGEAGAGVTVAVARRTRRRRQRPPAWCRGASARRCSPTSIPASFDLVVNATPLGHAGRGRPRRRGTPQPVTVRGRHRLPPHGDPLARRGCRARGIPCTNGLGMLVHQAALAFELWTGVDAPVDAMRDAATSHDAARDRMSVAIVVVCALVGLAVGWFLDPVIVRVPRRLPVRGPSPGSPTRSPTNRPPSTRSRSRPRSGGCSLACSPARCSRAWRARFDDSWALPAYLVLAGVAGRAVGDRPASTTCCPNRIVYPLTLRARGALHAAPPRSTTTGRRSVGVPPPVASPSPSSSCSTSCRRAAWASAT